MFGRARQCWQNEVRKNCTSNDPAFSRMEADLHNLAPAVSEINADRQNYNFGFIETSAANYGECDFKVDFKDSTAEPKDEVKGMLARVYFYMFDRYDLLMSHQQQQLLMQWNKTSPPSPWEIERDADRMGHSNPFVMGEAQWTLGHKNSKIGLSTATAKQNSSKANNDQQQNREIRGNKNSKTYHLSSDCHSYNKASPKNIIIFDPESATEASGYRKAGNCR